MIRIIRRISLVDGRPYWEVTVGDVTVRAYKRYSREAGHTLYMVDRAGFATLAAIVEWLQADSEGTER